MPKKKLENISEENSNAITKSNHGRGLANGYMATCKFTYWSAFCI
jgi:hypothetical protein